MTERLGKQPFFGQECFVHERVVVGKGRIHRGDIVQRRVSPSRTLWETILGIKNDGALQVYPSVISSEDIKPGTEVEKVFCPHDG